MFTQYSLSNDANDLITLTFTLMAAGKRQLASNVLYRLFDMSAIELDDAHWWM